MTANLSLNSRRFIGNNDELFEILFLWMQHIVFLFLFVFILALCVYPGPLRTLYITYSALSYPNE